MNKKNFFSLILIGLVSSCSQDEELPMVTSDESKETIEILKERDSRYPWSDNLFKENDTRVSISQNNPNDFLGRCWTFQDFPIENAKNFRFQALDVNSYQREYNNNDKNNIIRNSSQEVFAFANNSRITSQESYSKMFSVSTKLSLWLVKLKTEAYFNKTFSTSTEQSQNTVFGIFNYIFNGERHSLVYPDDEFSKKGIAAKHTTKAFKNALAMKTPTNFINEIGTHFLIDYISGGKANATYLGESQNYTSTESKESELKSTINSTIGKMVSNNLKYNVNETIKKSINETFSNLRMAVNTYGGDPLASPSIAPNNIGDVSFDLSSWQQGLADFSKHTIVDIEKGGLVPISDLILEQNLKKLYSQVDPEKLNTTSKMTEPFITIKKVQNGLSLGNNPKDWSSYIYLTTRYGDQLLLAKKEWSSLDKVQEFISEKYNELNQIFGVKIILSTFTSKSTTQTNSFPIVSAKDTYIFFEKQNMYKCIDTKNNITYLVYEPSPKKKRYVYTVFNDVIKYAYGLEQFIEKLPQKDIDLNAFCTDKYIINAL